MLLVSESALCKHNLETGRYWKRCLKKVLAIPNFQQLIPTPVSQTVHNNFVGKWVLNV